MKTEKVKQILKIINFQRSYSNVSYKVTKYNSNKNNNNLLIIF